MIISKVLTTDSNFYGHLSSFLFDLSYKNKKPRDIADCQEVS